MRLGVLDVGSNTVHLLLLDVYPGSRPEPYASHKLALRLVQYLDADGNISDAGRDALTAFVVEARDFAVDNRAEDFLAFATSAIREAGNGAQVLDHVQSRSGVTLTELAGDQEAAVTFFGAPLVRLGRGDRSRPRHRRRVLRDGPGGQRAAHRGDLGPARRGAAHPHLRRRGRRDPEGDEGPEDG